MPPLSGLSNNLKIEEADLFFFPATSEITTLQDAMLAENFVAVRSENMPNYFVVRLKMYRPVHCVTFPRVIRACRNEAVCSAADCTRH